MMSNIFFLRMDKESLEEHDLSPQYPYIHSIHGICGNKDPIKQQKNIIFPHLYLSERDLTQMIYNLKQKLIDNGELEEKDPGKQRCDLAIRYWLKTMQLGDSVLVRNQRNQLYLCKVASYVQENFFDKYGCFQRKVTNIQLLDEGLIPVEILDRTYGRKTIEKNASESIKTIFNGYFGTQ